MTLTSSAQQTAPMTLDRLRVLLDAYGAAPSRWPQAERIAAEALIDSSADARALLAEAAQFDAILDIVQPPEPSAALAERLRNRRFGLRGLPIVMLGDRFAGGARRWMVSTRNQALAVAAALLIGVFVGTGIPNGVEEATRALPTAALPHRDAGSLTVERMTPERSADLATLATTDYQYSSNGDPQFDAPDPFGRAAHGMDLVDGARLTSVPVPPEGGPMGSIPLL